MNKSAETVASIIEFFSMLSGGFFLALFFDIFRSMRKAVKKNNFKNFTGAVYVQDFLFLLAAFVVLVLLIYRVSGGNLDWYISLGCTVGAVAYYYLAEPLTGKVFFAIFYVIIKIVKNMVQGLKKLIILTKRCKKMLKKAGET